MDLTAESLARWIYDIQFGSGDTGVRPAKLRTIAEIVPKRPIYTCVLIERWDGEWPVKKRVMDRMIVEYGIETTIHALRGEIDGID